MDEVYLETATINIVLVNLETKKLKFLGGWCECPTITPKMMPLITHRAQPYASFEASAERKISEGDLVENFSFEKINNLILENYHKIVFAYLSYHVLGPG